MRSPSILAILGIVALAGAASADTIYLKGGGTLEGRVLDLTEQAVVLTLDGLEGSRVEVPLSRVSDFSQYEIRRSRVDRSSAKAREELGDWALQRNLLAFAMEEYAAAMKLSGEAASPQLQAKLEDASSRCGADKLARGKKLIDEGKLEEARSFFRDILKNHPKCPAAETARELVSSLDQRIRKARTAERENRRSESSLERLEDGLRGAEDLVAKGDRLRRLGYRESGSLGRAEDDFLAAVASYDRAREVLARVRKLPAARGREKDFEKIESGIEKRLLAVYVDLGHNFIVKGNLVRANHYMGLALAIDPNDPKALALRQAIAAATANDNWGRPVR